MRIFFLSLILFSLLAQADPLSDAMKFQNQQSVIYGPNCFNLSLVAAGILPARRYTTPKEMTFFVGSPLCRPLRPQERPIRGDIGDLRAGNEEVHAFVWLTETEVYSKQGNTAESPYITLDRIDMEKGYQDEQKKECQKDESLPCKLRLESYRCQSMAQYWLRLSAFKPQPLAQAFNSLDQAERSLSEANFGAFSLSQEEVHLLLEKFDNLPRNFERQDFLESFRRLPSRDQIFLRSAIQFRLNSLFHQILYTQERTPCELCSGLAPKFKPIVQALPH